jgi:Family of unknown function (DUF6295)
MCTYQTTTLAVSGSAKGAPDWFAVTDVSVYVDHPVHHPSGHAVLVDLRAPQRGPAARVALELDAPSARALAEAILEALEATGSALLDDAVPTG